MACQTQQIEKITGLLNNRDFEGNTDKMFCRLPDHHSNFWYNSNISFIGLCT